MFLMQIIHIIKTKSFYSANLIKLLEFFILKFIIILDLNELFSNNPFGNFKAFNS